MGWEIYYRTEQDLIRALGNIDIHKFNSLCNQDICRGYQYITILARKVKSNSELSPVQVRQAKRLASQIKKYHLSV